MRAPVIAVTGGIASGKTTVARILAAGGGTLVDCDSIGHEALRDGRVADRLIGLFGGEVLTPSGRISRRRLRRIAFSGREKMEALNGAIRPVLKRMISDRVRALRRARYIVLDAVLFFQYEFKFKADLVVLTEAPDEVRIGRLMSRNGLSRTEAELRLEVQRTLRDEWSGADVVINTDAPRSEVAGEAALLRDRFLEGYRRR